MLTIHDQIQETSRRTRTLHLDASRAHPSQSRAEEADRSACQA
jgi:hypothetical protein